MLESIIRTGIGRFVSVVSEPEQLRVERRNFENAMKQATERGKDRKSDPVVVGGQRVVVVDDGAARLVEPA